MSSITVSNLAKTYGAVRALDSASFVVDSGELAVVVGPSGCGKTTTLRLIAGLENPSAGSISIDGQATANLPPHHRNIAMVFQDLALYDRWTVFDNLAFALRQRKTPKAEIENAVRDAARLVEIERLLDRRAAELSGGQRQRVALGRAIARKPSVLLLDEPLAQLDPPLRLELRRRIRQLHRDLGMTMLYVTHDQEEALALAEKIIVLKDGQIRQAGSAADAYYRPADRFVAGFLGSPPMNLLTAAVLQGQQQPALIWQGQSSPMPGRLNEALKSASGEVVIGVRPQDVRLTKSPPASEPGWSMDMTIQDVEWVGPQSFVTAAAPNGERLVAISFEPGSLRPGERCTVNVRLDHAQAFSRDAQGKNLSLPGP